MNFDTMNEAKKIGSFLILMVFIAAWKPTVHAQEGSINFSNIGVKNGMTANWVTAICRDSEGLMWMGTNRGLNCFDGYNITGFESYSGDSTSLSNNFISCIAEDKQQNLWIGTTYGVNIKKPELTAFEQISMFDYNAFGCNDINNINDIYVAGNGDVFIGTHEGFFIYSNGQFQHHLIDSTRFDADINNVFSFAEDLHGNIWMGTFSRELVKLNKNSETLEFVTLPPFFEGKYVRGLQKLFIDSDNLLWIGSQAGMYIYDLSKQDWHPVLNNLLVTNVGNKV
ncbi:MAG: hypothetical protein JW761_06755, partial [Prolixibacteraceae bacterium]|nr:hypothetical protein [Prolixibacteraceae bacterium]